VLFGNELRWFEPQHRHIFLGVGGGICFKLTSAQLNCEITHPLFIYLFIVSKVTFVLLTGIEMRVTQIFLLLSFNCCFFVYRRSDLEGSCSNGT